MCVLHLKCIRLYLPPFKCSIATWPYWLLEWTSRSRFLGWDRIDLILRTPVIAGPSLQWSNTMFSCLMQLRVCSWAQINVQDWSSLAFRVHTAQAHRLPNCNYRVLSSMDPELMSWHFLYSRNEIKAGRSHIHKRPTETCSSIKQIVQPW